MLRPLLLVLTAIVCGCSFEGSSSSPATTTSSALGTITRLGGVVSTGTVSPSQTTTFLPLPNGVWVWCADDGPHGVEPYRTDGTVAGTTLLRDLSAGPSPGCRTFVTTNGRALFSGITGVWSSDGT
jgi:ELWxxDGT repeat protein